MRFFLRGRHFLKRLVFLTLLVWAGPLSNLARADFEEVRIVRVEPVHVQSCAPGSRTAQPQQVPRQPGAGITTTQVLGGVSGAAVGGILGHQVGSGSGKTAATVAGAGLGAYAGYKLTEEKPASDTPQPNQPASSGISGTQVLGGVAGAAVGGVVGNQFGSGSGKTAATVAGAGLGAYAGYKLTEARPQQGPPAAGQKPAPATQHAQAPCSLATQHRIEYARSNGLQGEVMMSSEPTGSSLLMSFCGDTPCN